MGTVNGGGDVEVIEPFDIFPSYQYSRCRPNILNLNQKCIYSTFMVGKPGGKTPFGRSRGEDNIKMALM